MIQKEHLQTFDDVIKEIQKAIDDVKLQDITEPTFCNIINTYFTAIDKVKQQICGVTPKPKGAYNNAWHSTE